MRTLQEGGLGKGRGASSVGTLPQLPVALQKFLMFEQRNLWKPERFRLARNVNQFDPQYLPEQGRMFQIPCFRLKHKYVYFEGERDWVNRALNISGHDGPETDTLFPIHPAELGYYEKFLRDSCARNAAEDGLRLIGTPTSSTRTLLVWPDLQPERAIFTKLSLHSRFLGDRTLPRRKVAGSVGLSQLFQQISGTLPAGIGHFREPCALVPRRMQDSGVVFRSIPDEIIHDGVLVAPLFALIGGSDHHPALLLRVLEGGRVRLREIVEAVLLEKFASLWIELVFDHGLILEAHGQDLLLSLSEDLMPVGRFYYRDFEGLAVDWALRRARSLPEPESVPYAFEWFHTYETWGYPLYQLVSMKIWTSLTDYVHLFLRELETALLEWQANGVLAKDTFEAGEVTLLFSRCLRRVVREKFGLREAEEYDIRHQLNRFVKFLMQVRREVMRAVV